MRTKADDAFDVCVAVGGVNMEECIAFADEVQIKSSIGSLLVNAV